MKLTDFFLAQLEREAAITRPALERVPEGRPDWKPHEKSMPLGYLSQLVATMTGWVALTILQDEHLTTTRWRLLVSGHVVANNPRHEVLADTFTHLAHHRGQLTVYLRLNDAKVPSIYGPTADDKSFG